MKLTIDTKEDSHEEIRKAIRMLSTIVGDEHVYTNTPKAPVANIFESSSNEVTPSTSEPSQGNIFGNMFGDISPSSPSTEASEEKLESEIPNSRSEASRKKEDNEKPQVIVEY